MLLCYILNLLSIFAAAGGANHQNRMSGIQSAVFGTSGGAQLQAEILFVKHRYKSVSPESMSVDVCLDDYVKGLPTLRRFFGMCAASYLPCLTREHGALADQDTIYREPP